MTPLRYFIVSLFLALYTNGNSQTLKIDVSGIRKQKGEIMVALFNQPQGFPFETAKAFRLLKGIPEGGNISFVVDALPRGKYAIALFHDINGDAVLNLNLFGIPKEGYGVSNNAFNTFSAPKYPDASFDHEKNSTQKIMMKY
jgi:uncharacterized protein (DUF2141 family)